MISVVIPTYNEEKNITRCLKSLTSQTIHRKSYEIIVVDGNSNDKTRKLARKYADKVIIQKSEGVGGARNDGVRIAKGDIIATTDADCIVPRDWLEVISENLKNTEYIAVYGLDYPIEKTIKSGFFYFIMRIIVTVGSYLAYYSLGGTNSAFKKKPFLKIGGYRNLSHSDDVDLGLRLRKIGKMKFDKKMIARISIRRLQKQGYLKTTLTWIEGDLRLMLGLKIPKKQYARMKY